MILELGLVFLRRLFFDLLIRASMTFLWRLSMSILKIDGTTLIGYPILSQLSIEREAAYI